MGKQAKRSDLAREVGRVPLIFYGTGTILGAGIFVVIGEVLGRVDKRDSQSLLGVIQAVICDGDQLGTRPDVGRGMGVL